MKPNRLMKKLLVVGSYNVDLISMTDRLPAPGETVLGSSFFTCPGGKGANQAVAAAKMGQDTTFLAKVGADSFGAEAVQFLKKQHINADLVRQEQGCKTGTAQIIVNSQGENIIVVSPGANNLFSSDDMMSNEAVISEVDAILVQFEIPKETIETAIQLAKKHNKTVIVNPAPVLDLDQSALRGIDYLTPNEHELKLLSKCASLASIQEIKEAGIKVIREYSVKNLIVTLGSKGVLYQSEEKSVLYPSFKVNAIDTSGAGDCFNGAFSYFLLQGLSMDDVVFYASAAAALSVTRLGTSSSYPDLQEVMTFASEHQIEESRLL